MSVHVTTEYQSAESASENQKRKQNLVSHFNVAACRRSPLSPSSNITAQPNSVTRFFLRYKTKTTFKIKFSITQITLNKQINIRNKRERLNQTLSRYKFNVHIYTPSRPPHPPRHDSSSLSLHDYPYPQ